MTDICFSDWVQFLIQGPQLHEIFIFSKRGGLLQKQFSNGAKIVWKS